MKHLIWLALILILSGCSLKQNSAQVNNYAIDFTLTSKTFTSTEKTIFVHEPTVNRSFASKRIYYTLKPYSFEAYALNQWIDFPSSMLHQKLNDTLEQSQLFKYTFHTPVKLNFDYELRTHIGQLYHSFENESSDAIVNVKFELLKKGDLEKVLVFKKTIKCESNDAYGFVKAVNEAFKQINASLVVQLHNAIAL